MTRKEQISEALNHVVSSSDHPFLTIEDAVKKEGFRLGVNWADSHPDWHKYPEDKPKMGDEYLVIFKDKSYILASYYENDHFVIDFMGFYEVLEDQDVLAWMEKPQLPEFD